MKLSLNVQQNGGGVVAPGTTVNNAGSAMRAGSSSSLLDNVDPSYADYLGGSVVADGDNTDPALSGGIFAYNRQEPVAKRITTVLGGSTTVDSKLLSGGEIVGQDQRRDIHYNDNVKTRRVATAIRAGNFNPYGIAQQRSNFTVAPVVGTDNFGNDNAATVNRASPGNLVFKLGGPSSSTNPVTDTYYSPQDEKTG